ncbi:Sec-independent protein translocase subunit TatA [Streptomyces sp. NPDC005263]|uniref:Sec-independent protein translocase subunit TatA n=1 Tax=Streptomyces sp. NPDC005263 TaxID=3364711 RepID=UPI0036985283
MLRNGLEPWHLLVLAIVVIVLFGSRKLPDTARALGKSMRILKSEAKALKDESASPPAEAEAGPAVASNVTDATVPPASVNVPVSEPPAAGR